MDFRFTQEQQDLIDAAKTIFDGENTSERMRAMVTGKEASALWPTLAQMGLIGIMAPQARGGLEQPLVVMAAVAEAAGYAGIPEPIVETAGVAIPLLMKAGEVKAVEGLIAGGPHIGLISPLLKYPNCAGFCEQFIVTKPDGVSLVSKDDVTLSPIKSIDPLRWPFKTDITGSPNALAQWHGGVLSAAQLVGLSKRMIDLSVDYAKERHQFGKPIGSFQAIKHHLATVYTQVEFTRPMVHLAAIQGGRAVHTAKVAAIDTALLAAETAIQVHGGMGYTFEVDLHLYMKRAWALISEWGDRNHHMKQLEDLILGGQSDLGPATTFI